MLIGQLVKTNLYASCPFLSIGYSRGNSVLKRVHIQTLFFENELICIKWTCTWSAFSYEGFRTKTHFDIEATRKWPNLLYFAACACHAISQSQMYRLNVDSLAGS